MLYPSLEFYLPLSLSPLIFSIHQHMVFQAFLQMVSIPFPQHVKQKNCSLSCPRTAQPHIFQPSSVEHGWVAVPLYGEHEPIH